MRVGTPKEENTHWDGKTSVDKTGWKRPSGEKTQRGKDRGVKPGMEKTQWGKAVGGTRPGWKRHRREKDLGRKRPGKEIGVERTGGKKTGREKTYHQNNRPTRTEYNRYRNFVTNEIQKPKEKYHHSLFTSMKNNIRKNW